MNIVQDFMSGHYRKCLNYPIIIIAMILPLCVAAVHYSRQFSFDASADSLVAQNDPDLAYYREVSQSFGGDDFLFLTYSSSEQSIFSASMLADIAGLVAALEQIEGVRAVTSILDAPLLRSPPVPLAELATGYKTLLSPGVDLSLARAELIESPLFSELLISTDGRHTAMRIDLIEDLELSSLQSQRDTLRQKTDLSTEESNLLRDIESRYRLEAAEQTAARARTLAAIRAIIAAFDSQIDAQLGGVPLVASDMIEYVKNDIVVFGVSVLVLVAIMLHIAFRRVRWVVLPLLSTAVTLLLTIGLLGAMRQPTTAISSNFVSLLAIISISFSIHLITKYRELRASQDFMSHTDLVYHTMADKLAPCIYTALTTMVAFGSLITSSIVPVRDFGFIMCIGVLISFLVTYSLFASVLVLLPKGEASVTLHHEPMLTGLLGKVATERTGLVGFMTLLVVTISIAGINNLSLGNRFIDYFRANTAIHQGLAFIDENMGGTIPFDIMLDFEPFVERVVDSDDDFFTAEVDSYPQRYWFTQDKLDVVSAMHAYLEQRLEIGKIISMATLEAIARDINNGEPLGSVQLVAAIGAVPDEIRANLIDPYASPSAGLMKISTRLHETGPVYSHRELINDIEQYAQNELGLAPESVHVTGMAVLFNGMLEQLYDSQASSIVFVVVAIFLLFTVLLRSFSLAIIGLIPNILAAVVILGIMGFLGIPLDMMTITIAAIIIGIGVDDAVHYLHRYQAEFAEHGEVKLAIMNSHASIGDAIYYTSCTVIIGFSVLAFSSFIPTVYFGILTASAMLLALIANLTVLPALLVLAFRNSGVQE